MQRGWSFGYFTYHKGIPDTLLFLLLCWWNNKRAFSYSRLHFGNSFRDIVSNYVCEVFAYSTFGRDSPVSSRKRALCILFHCHHSIEGRPCHLIEKKKKKKTHTHTLNHADRKTQVAAPTKMRNIGLCDKVTSFAFLYVSNLFDGFWVTHTF